MRFSKLVLKNWRNFLAVNVALRERMFIVGPNASGKSNLLDALRFLRDLAEPRGGFHQAVSSRGGVSRIRSLHARRDPDVVIEVEIDLGGTSWRYHLAFGLDKSRRPVIKRERVWRGGEEILNRPDLDDKEDPVNRTRFPGHEFVSDDARLVKGGVDANVHAASRSHSRRIWAGLLKPSFSTRQCSL